MTRIDAGQFKVAFEDAQKNNAKLLGVPIVSHEKDKTPEQVEESESQEPEPKQEEPAKDDAKEKE
jgi:Ran-binding protein 1